MYFELPKQTYQVDFQGHENDIGFLYLTAVNEELDQQTRLKAINLLGYIWSYQAIHALEEVIPSVDKFYKTAAHESILQIEGILASFGKKKQSFKVLKLTAQQRFLVNIFIFGLIYYCGVKGFHLKLLSQLKFLSYSSNKIILILAIAISAFAFGYWFKSRLNKKSSKSPDPVENREEWGWPG